MSCWETSRMVMVMMRMTKTMLSITTIQLTCFSIHSRSTKMKPLLVLFLFISRERFILDMEVNSGHMIRRFLNAFQGYIPRIEAVGNTDHGNKTLRVRVEWETWRVAIRLKESTQQHKQLEWCTRIGGKIFACAVCKTQAANQTFQQHYPSCV